MTSSLKCASLLINLHRARLSEGEKSELHEQWLALSDSEKRELFELASQNSAMIWTLKQLRICGADVSEELEGVQKQLDIERRRRKLIVEMTEFFRDHHLDLIVLKGNALGFWIYNDPHYKRMNDFDVLIRHDQLLQVKKALWSLGYRSSGALLRGKENPASTHHLSPWIHESLDCILGIHWNIISPKREPKVPVEALWKNRVRMIDLPADRLSTPHFLMHLALHLPRFKTGIRELSDLLNLAEFAEDREEAIKQISMLAREWNAENALKSAISQALALDPHSPLGQVYPDVRPHPDGQRILHYRTLHLSRVEKAFARSWLSEHPQTRMLGWWSTWKLTLFAPLKDACAILRVSRPRSSTEHLKIRFLAPFKIWSALCSEHGTFNIWIATLFNFGNALKSAIQWGFHSKRDSSGNPLDLVLDRLE